MHLSQALPRLFVGSCPSNADDIGRLNADYGITAILNLQTDHDFDYWDFDWNRIHARCRELGIEVRRIPVDDGDASDLRKKLPQCVDAADELLRAGHIVYAQCNADAGRSSSVAVALLHWKQGWKLAEAIERVARCRYCRPDIESILSSGAGKVAA